MATIAVQRNQRKKVEETGHSREIAPQIDILTILTRELVSLGLKFGDQFMIDPSSEYHDGDVVAARVDGTNVIGKVGLYTTKQVKLLVPQIIGEHVVNRCVFAPIDSILGEVCPLVLAGLRKDGEDL
ncbi:MAG: S24 family peptidase [Acidobacteria bacterium]|nr:S24 family peptidase [Acidobacteriota bacterium]